MALPRFDVEFTREGRPFDASQVDRMLGGLAGVTDLVVIAHGWNNDLADARALYDRFFDTLERVRGLGADDGRRFAACQVFWPSKKFTEAELIPGGGAASARAENDASLRAVVDALGREPRRLPADASAIAVEGDGSSEVRQALVERARQLAHRLDTAAGREQFVGTLRALLDPSHASDDDASVEFFTRDPEELFADMQAPVVAPLGTGGGGAAALAGTSGSAIGLQDMLGGVTAAARRLANFATYYQMKSRAGAVGSFGLAPVLQQIRRRQGRVKIHLAGHSFGARVVSAAAVGFAQGSPNITITLLQAAYSHHGLAAHYKPNQHGAFRTLLADRRASGPIIITHTKNDRAVGIAYPLASRIARESAAALGDENDPYGGMGRNGARHTPEAEGRAQELRQVGHEYGFQAGGVYNLKADAFIKDHGDVTGPQVAFAFLAAARTI